MVSYVFFQIIDIFGTYCWMVIDHKDSYVLRKILADRLSLIGIQNLEKPEVSNKSQRFNEEIPTITSYVQMFIGTFSLLITFLGAGVVLLKSIPLVTGLFFIVTIFKFLSNQKYIRLLWLLTKSTTEERRKTASALNDLTEPAPLKELILSQGRFFLIRKINVYIEYISNSYSQIRKSWNVSKIVNTILDSVVFGYGIIIILRRLVDGLISIGQLTFEIRSLRIFSDTISNFMNNLVFLREQAVKLEDVHELFVKYDEDRNGVKVIKNNNLDIKVDSISFKYPNSAKLIFKDLDFKIKAGEKIAIVGENGAGKTTLVKLLCRFYRVNSGKISISGIDINDLEIDSWYKKIGVLFQDYNAYTNLTVRENVEIDSQNKIVTDKSVFDSLKQANALFVKKYKNGINQILSERYKDGIRPSTGQWQKIAIARVFHRNSPVLILDEPTASIDAVAEAKIFDNIYKFTKDKTVIIISHRFSTVRSADRIIVLDKGKIIEQGSHKELLRNNGKYAKAFNLQARGYQ